MKILLFIFIALKANLLKEEENDEPIHIEINSAKIKKGRFFIKSDSESKDLASKISKSLLYTKRFEEQNTYNSDCDILISIKKIDKKIVLTVSDCQTGRVKKFAIRRQNNKTVNFLLDKIYQMNTGEKGIFSTSLVFSTNIGSGLFTLYSINFNKENLQQLTQPISHLNGIIYLKKKLFITKFSSDKKGFAVFSYNLKHNEFFKVISIKHGSVFSPAINNEDLFISVSHKGTTGIYSLPLNKTREYLNFIDFKNDPEVQTVTKIKGKIATSINIIGNLKVFCANYNNKASIYILPNKKISSNEGAYYDPTLFNKNYLATVKIANRSFHLVVINLKTGEEKVILSKFFIGKPTWSPCGNWIAVPCRNKNQKDSVLLVHKSGKYITKLSLKNTSIKHVIWKKQ